MSVIVLHGGAFPGVEFGTATGHANRGYIIGSTPIVEFLRADKSNPANLTGVKYSHHEVADPIEGPREPTTDIRITMLVDGGPWYMHVWSKEADRSVEVVLCGPGAFIAWLPGVWHEWRPLGRATMATVSLSRAGSV